MNQIYLGQRAYGFAAASEIYFGKPLKDITVAEAAMLAGLPKAPSAQQPDRQPRARHAAASVTSSTACSRTASSPPSSATRRMNQVLQVPRAVATSPVHAEYVAEMARQIDLRAVRRRGLHARPERLPDARLRRPDRRPTTPCARASWTSSGARSIAARRTTSTCPPTRRSSTRASPRRWQDHPDNDDLKAAVVARGVAEEGRRRCCRAARRVTHHRRRPEAGRHRRSSAKANPKTQIRPGAVVRADPRTPRATGRSRSCPRSKARSSRWTRAPARSARWSAASTTRKSKFNHVTQAWRQPGSSFKPFIYSAALEKGFTPATVINDAPLFFDAGTTGSQPWEPKNYDGTFDGPMTMRQRPGEVEEHGLDPHPARRSARPTRSSGSRASASIAEKHPRLPDDGARRRLGHADADGRRPTASSPTAAIASTRRSSAAITDAKGKRAQRGAHAGARRIDARASTRATPS